MVFDVEAGAPWPSLAFRFALVSPEFPWYPASAIWFLNDLAAISDRELYVSQFGPTGNLLVPKRLWRCAWDEAAVRPDGRLLADCAHAWPETSIGLNGMNIDAATTATGGIAPFSRDPAFVYGPSQVKCTGVGENGPGRPRPCRRRPRSGRTTSSSTGSGSSTGTPRRAPSAAGGRVISLQAALLYMGSP